ncbi:MAG TPA: CPBP family glutamic-type intramembrane protease [Patescibacteria group bacterium]
MPSKKKLPQANPIHFSLFVLLVSLTFILWVVYRFRLHFPIWFDETVGKALFFAAPTWVFINATRAKSLLESWQLSKLKPGLLQGIAFGGIFGFVASLTTLFTSSSKVVAAPLFISDVFWWEFMMALLTGFWETLFFFSFVLTVLLQMYSKDTLKAILWAVFIFVAFHVPNTLLRFQLADVPLQIVLLVLFAVGQSLIYLYRRNSYTLVISHAVWGMALLVHMG